MNLNTSSQNENYEKFYQTHTPVPKETDFQLNNENERKFYNIFPGIQGISKIKI